MHDATALDQLTLAALLLPDQASFLRLQLCQSTYGGLAARVRYKQSLLCLVAAWLWRGLCAWHAESAAGKRSTVRHSGMAGRFQLQHV